MTLDGLRAPGANVPGSDEAAALHARNLDVARKFEAVLMRQLVSVMRKTAQGGGLMGSQGASGQYMAMFDEVMADKLAEGGGVGLAAVLAEALGPTPPPVQSLAAAPAAQGLGRVSPAIDSPPLPGLAGATQRLAHAAYALSAREGGKPWAKEGELSTRELSSDLATEAEGGIARFNVRDAQGYRGAYKCNLFALEAARRAGFQVPVVARRHGWGYPASNAVTHDAQDGSLRAGWATVVEGPARLKQITAQLERGEVAVLLTGASDDGRHGHMAVVERIHKVELDARGEVRRIEFDGYEARASGAEHLVRRTWNREGDVGEVRGARNGFEQIELLSLTPAVDAQQAEITTSSEAPASARDFPSRSER